MSFIDDILNEGVSAAQVAANTQSGVYGGSGGFGGFSLSSGLQQLLTVGAGYAKGVADIDLARRAVEIQRQAQQPTLSTTQSPIYFGGPDLTSRGVAAVGGIRLGNLIPFALLGLGAYVVLRKG